MMTAAAVPALIAILSALAIFQASLAAGAPLGHFAWGGQHRVLPSRLRIGSLVAIAIYGLIALAVLHKTGLLAWIPGKDWASVACWVIVAYLAPSIPLNAISRSRPERLTMTPVVTALFGLMLVVALAP